MGEANWQALKAHFSAAVTLEGEALENYLRDVAAREPDTASALRKLLTANSTIGSPLTGAVSSAAARLQSAEREALIGTPVGSWVVESHLAHGGMGDVYIGSRADGAFEQRVAVKFIGAGVLGGSAAERFAFEQRILARLNHPNIARILDVGATPEGQSFLVMEYVDGLPIDDYCAAHDLGVRERLQLFAGVCDAVAFAHSNLVVHRDVKPANVLVEAGGRVKLLDFGIAKLLEEQADAAPVNERTQHAMTPDYASPEQVLGQPITTRSDVYSLGVLLYQLLTGLKPYATRDLRPSQVEKLVCEDEVLLPSRRAAAAGRPELATELRGDLDQIVLKAMAKHPDARYASVPELAADLRRQRLGFPVHAQRRSWMYAAGKFVRRHALAVTATTLTAAAGVGFGLYHSLALARERDLAAEQAARAEAVAKFLTEVFSATDPDVAQGQPLTAAELLEAGAARIDSDLDTTPSLRASLSTAIADAYESLGDYEKALALYRKSQQLHEQHGGSVADRARDLRNIAGALFELDQLDESLAAAEEALALRRQLYPGDNLDVAISLNEYAHALSALGDYTQAIEAYREALAMNQRLPEPSAVHMADMQHDLGQALLMNGQGAEAEPLVRAALAGGLELYGENNTFVSVFLQTLAMVLSDLQRPAEARDLMNRALAIDLAIHPDHPDLEATMVSLGMVEMQLGNLDAAEEHIRKAVEHSRRTRGEEHEATAYDELQLANLLARRGKHAEARANYDKALATYRRVLEPDNPYIASTLVGYAGLLNTIGEPRAALEMATEARDIATAQLPPEHWLGAHADSARSEALLQLGRVAEAGPLLEAAYANLAESQPGGPATRLTLSRLVTYYRRTGNKEALQRHEALLAEMEAGESK